MLRTVIALATFELAASHGALFIPPPRNAADK